MKLNLNKGFTLIELLVVITIIGILATGATTVFTSQIQKARDTTRITSLEGLKGSVEQVYQDTSRYPDNATAAAFSGAIRGYMEVFPADPKNDKTCNGGALCGLFYTAGADKNGLIRGAYELSTAFENSGNVDNKAATDNGDDGARFELGIQIDSNVTGGLGTSTATSPASVIDGIYIIDNTAGAEVLVINGES